MSPVAQHERKAFVAGEGFFPHGKAPLRIKTPHPALRATFSHKGRREEVNAFPSRCDQLPDLRITLGGMVKMHPLLSTCSKCLVAAAFAAALATLGSPTG